MKFEYKLNYDFVSGELSFEITKMPEEYRARGIITTIACDNGNCYHVRSHSHTEIGSYSGDVFLRGYDRDIDTKVDVKCVKPDFAVNFADVLKKFQQWVENQNNEVEMTVAEIEEKLGIKNLKIIKENT